MSENPGVIVRSRYYSQRDFHHQLVQQLGRIKLDEQPPLPGARRNHKHRGQDEHNIKI